MESKKTALSRANNEYFYSFTQTSVFKAHGREREGEKEGFYRYLKAAPKGSSYLNGNIERHILSSIPGHADVTKKESDAAESKIYQRERIRSKDGIL